MRHCTAVKVNIPSGEGWHYADVGSQGGRPIGNCVNHPPHATESEARRCYQQWRRGRVELTDRRSSWTSCQVRPCKNPARNIATIEGDGYAMAVLCDEHFTLKDATTALMLDGDEAGDQWRS